VRERNGGRKGLLKKNVKTVNQGGGKRERKKFGGERDRGAITGRSADLRREGARGNKRTKKIVQQKGKKEKVRSRLSPTKINAAQ